MDNVLSLDDPDPGSYVGGFYCRGPEGTVSEEIRAFLDQIGWSPLFPET